MTSKQADDRWIIEEAGEPVGMIVRDEAGFVFHAAATDVWSLDQQVFPNAHAAQQAAKDLLRIKRRPPLNKAARR
ncbi:MAG: hypothetical protein ACTSW2_06355 [Alphaproteobacteria bacterium]